MSNRRHDLDELHGDTVVAFLEIKLRRSGCMSVAGSITDEQYALHLLDTARETVKNFHVRQRMGRGEKIIVPAHDTSLVGTPQEKALLAARDELSDAMSGR